MPDPTRAGISRPSSTPEGPSPYVAQTVRLLAVTVEMVTSFERSWDDPLLVEAVRHAVGALQVLDPEAVPETDHELNEALDALADMVAALPSAAGTDGDRSPN